MMGHNIIHMLCVLWNVTVYETMYTMIVHTLIPGTSSTVLLVVVGFQFSLTLSRVSLLLALSFALPWQWQWRRRRRSLVLDLCVREVLRDRSTRSRSSSRFLVNTCLAAGWSQLFLRITILFCVTLLSSPSFRRRELRRWDRGRTARFSGLFRRQFTVVCFSLCNCPLSFLVSTNGNWCRGRWWLLLLLF